MLDLMVRNESVGLLIELAEVNDRWELVISFSVVSTHICSS